MLHLADRHLDLSPFNARMAILDRDQAVVAPVGPRRSKVAMVGAGSSRILAPVESDEFEVWSLNAVPVLDHAGRLRCDRWFEMHEAHAQNDADWRWIDHVPVPLYVPPHDTALLARTAMAVPYPLEEIERAYGMYWACTFSYELALALRDGFTTVGLYGVELAFGDERERTVEWACVSWWMGYLEGKGIAFEVPGTAPLGRHTARYGVEYDKEKDAVLRYVAQNRARDRMRAQRVDHVGVGG